MSFASRRRHVEADAENAVHQLDRFGHAIPTANLARAELDLIDAEEAASATDWATLLDTLTPQTRFRKPDPVAAAVIALVEDRQRSYKEAVDRARVNRDRLAAAVDSMTPKVPVATRLQAPPVTLAPGARVPGKAELTRLTD